MSSPHPQLNGRYEIFDNYHDARKMALSDQHIRRVKITLGDIVTPPGKSGSEQK